MFLGKYYEKQQIDNVLAIEEAATLTTDAQKINKDDVVNYNELPPPPDGGEY